MRAGVPGEHVAADLRRAFTDVPVKMLTDKTYAAGLRTSIRLDRATPSSMLADAPESRSGPNTTHFSIVDAEGNRVAGTITLDGEPSSVAFISQDGAVRRIVANTLQASYALAADDPYIRTVITTPHATIYMNPVFRYDGEHLRSPHAEVDNTATWVQRVGALLAVLLVSATVPIGAQRTLDVPVHVRRLSDKAIVVSLGDFVWANQTAHQLFGYEDGTLPGSPVDELVPERLRMAHRVPECFGGLTGERAAGGIGDGAGDHQRQALAARIEFLFASENGGLGIERVKHRLDQDQIGATVEQAGQRFAIAVFQLVKADIAKRRVIHIR